jgi:hypothetical protein
MHSAVASWGVQRNTAKKGEKENRDVGFFLKFLYLVGASFFWQQAELPCRRTQCQFLPNGTKGRVKALRSGFSIPNGVSAKAHVVIYTTNRAR